MDFHWSLSDSKSPQVSRTLFSILVNLNYPVLWTVSTRPLISKSSSLVSILWFFFFFFFFRVFLHPCLLMVFHWSLSDSKSPLVSRTRLRILAVLSNAVVWIVSTHPPTSKSSWPFNNPLVIVPNAPITIGTIVTFMFHSLRSGLLVGIR